MEDRGFFFKYQILSIQGEAKEWTPYNAELNLQGIKVKKIKMIRAFKQINQIFKVLVKNPTPTKVKKDGSFEDTMLLLELMREKKQKENKMKKEEMIRQMAMEQKMKNQNQAIKLTF